jgi:hypothetical protein
MLGLRSATATVVLCVPTGDRKASTPVLDVARLVPDAAGRCFHLAAGTSQPVNTGDTIGLDGATLLQFAKDPPPTS